MEVNDNLWNNVDFLKNQFLQEKRIRDVRHMCFPAQPNYTESKSETNGGLKVKRDIILSSIEQCILSIVQKVSRGEPPFLQYNNRTKWQNTQFDKDLGVQLAVDSSCTSIRFESIQSINKFALTLKILSLIYKLVQSDSYATKRDIYYEDPSVYGSQACLDELVENISCMLRLPRHQLHVLATSKGYIAGDLDYMEHDGNHVDCRSSSNGVVVPSHVDGVKNMHSSAKMVLVVEKDATFQRLLDAGLLTTLHPCILITGKGVPDVNTRMMVRKLWDTLQLPTLALVDADPHGIEIMSVYKYGSLSMSHDADNLTVPTLRWLGVHPTDIDRLRIPSGALLDLTDTDRQKAKSLLSRPYIDHQPLWKIQIERLLTLGKKAEIQSLAAISPSYLTQVYLPNKLRFGGWI